MKTILIYGLAILFIAFIALYLIGNKSVRTEIHILAAPEEVWAVLSDLETVKEWNPVLIPIKGELKEGASIEYEFHQDADNISRIPATVKKIEENRLLNQAGGLTGIITFDHRYILQPQESGTRVIIQEDYQGAMVPFWDPTPVGEAYERLAKALQERVIKLKGDGTE